MVLNIVLAGDNDLGKHLIEEKLIDMIFPLCKSLSKRVRVQALWIIGNSGLFEIGFQSDVLAKSVVDAILEVCLKSKFISVNYIHFVIVCNTRKYNFPYLKTQLIAYCACNFLELVRFNRVMIRLHN